MTSSMLRLVFAAYISAHAELDWIGLDWIGFSASTGYVDLYFDILISVHHHIDHRGDAHGEQTQNHFALQSAQHFEISKLFCAVREKWRMEGMVLNRFESVQI